MRTKYAVIGTATSATDLAAALAWFLRGWGGSVRAVPLEKYDLEDGTSGQRWVEGQRLEGDEVVIRVEELLTTGGSALKANDAIRAVYPDVEFFPLMPVLVDRQALGPITAVGGLDVATAYRFEGACIWDPVKGEVCELCAAGSEAIRPKEGDNWAQLTGKV